MFCCFSHPVCHHLLQQLELNKAEPKSWLIPASTHFPSERASNPELTSAFHTRASDSFCESPDFVKDSSLMATSIL